MSDKTDSALGNGSDLGRGGYDDVNFFGIDEFGDPAGLGALYGAMIGSGAGTLAAIGYRSFRSADPFYSELVGLAAGVLAGGVMVAMGQNTRHAGWTAMAAAVLSNGLRAAEAHFRGGATAPPSSTQPGTHGAQIDMLRGHQVEALNGAAAHLLGSPSQVQLMGGPQVSMMAQKYGSTYVGQR